MYAENLTLGASAKAIAMRLAGTAYRDGGIIRERETGRIVCFLHDSDLPQFQDTTAASTLVPVAVLGVSMNALQKRLDNIEYALRKIDEKLDAIASDTKVLNIKMDATLLGNLLGAMHACELDLAKNNTEHLSSYKNRFLECFHQFRLFSLKIAQDPTLLRSYEDALSQYSQAMVIAGVAARDLLVRMGDIVGAQTLTALIANSINELALQTEAILKKPSSLFWAERTHRATLKSLQESHARVRGHQEALRALPLSVIEAAVSKQVTE